MPVATPDQYLEMLNRAKQGGFAYPAINVSSSQTLNAALAGLQAAGSDGIIQVTTGGGEDGYDLLRSALAALRGPLRAERLRATLVAGPLLAAEAFADLASKHPLLVGTTTRATTALGAGYWVLTPLQMADGVQVLVNRGFVPQDQRAQWQALPSDSKPVHRLMGRA